ncbi:unnamed protein product [Lathyrus sativus]|nr:unnamed protein product [Lathyrus sativus]
MDNKGFARSVWMLIDHVKIRFSVALLSKSNWRVLSEKDLMWSKLLSFRYGDTKAKIISAFEPANQRKDSLWWKDVRAVGSILKMKLPGSPYSLSYF